MRMPAVLEQNEHEGALENIGNIGRNIGPHWASEPPSIDNCSICILDLLFWHEATPQNVSPIAESCLLTIVSVKC